MSEVQSHLKLLAWRDVMQYEHYFVDSGSKIQSILAFVEGSVGLLLSSFVILSILYYRENFKKQIKLYFNLVVACFFAGLYLVVSRAVNLVFHFQKHPEYELFHNASSYSTIKLDIESELVYFPACVFILYFWIITRNIIFLSSIPITLDRLLAVTQSIRYKQFTTNRFFLGVISLTWIVSIVHVAVVAVLAHFQHHKIYLSQHTLTCSYDHHEFSAHVSLSVYLGFGVTTLLYHVVCYLIMFLTLKRRPKFSKSSTKLLKIGMLIAGTFSITWLPQVILKIVNHIQSENNTDVHSRPPNSVEFVCFVLSNLSPTINCVIYIFFVKTIRKTLLRSYSASFGTAAVKVQHMRMRLSVVRAFQTNTAKISGAVEGEGGLQAGGVGQTQGLGQEGKCDEYSSDLELESAGSLGESGCNGRVSNEINDSLSEADYKYIDVLEDQSDQNLLDPTHAQIL